MQSKSRILQCASLLLAGCALFFSACGSGGSSSSGGGSGSGTGILHLSATDAPFQFDIVTAASIDVDKITIYQDAEGDAGPIVLYQGTPILLDLFHLHDGITQNVDTSTLPVGLYRQLRLRVTHAELTLTNGNHYTTDDDTIRLTSQGTSGFKVFVDPPIDIQSDTTSDVLLDFDLTHTFKPVPANDPLDANFYHLHPVIHVSNLGNTGGIQGTVSQDDGSGTLVPVELATVYVLPPGQTDTNLAIATSATSAAGTYTFLGLAPGPVDVLAVKGELSAQANGINVVAGDIVQVDLVLNDGTGAVQGVVMQDNGAGGTTTVPGANVYVLPPGQTDPAQAVATGVTGANGAYSLTGIPAGTYDVRAVLGTLSGATPGVVIVAGSTTAADVLINDGTGGVAGTVTMADGTTTVAGANVYVLPPGQTDPAQAVATGVTAVDGTYSLTGILAGTYDVRAVLDPLSGTVPGVVIVAGSTTQAVIMIQ